MLAQRPNFIASFAALHLCVAAITAVPNASAVNTTTTTTSTTTASYENPDIISQTLLGSTAYYKPLKAVLVAAGFAGTIGLLHTQLQNFLTKQAAFSAVSYAILVAVFSFSLLSTLYRAVVPLSDTGRFLHIDSTEACFLLQWYGPVSLLSMLFIGHFLVASLLILFTPAPKVARQGMEEQFQENQFGFHVISGLAHLLRADSMNTFLVIYLIVFVFQLSRVPFVYAYASFHEDMLAHVERLALGKMDASSTIDWLADHAGLINGTFSDTTLLSPYSDMMSISPGVASVGLTFLYLVLTWAAFIIVYDRLSGRSFQQDFPFVVLVRAFPWLLRLEPVVGVLTAQLYKLSKTPEEFEHYAAQGFDILNQGNDCLREVRALVLSDVQKMKAQIHSLTDNLQEELDKHGFTTEELKAAINKFCTSVAQLETATARELAEKINADTVCRSLFGKVRKLMQKAHDAKVTEDILPGDSAYVDTLSQRVSDLSTAFGKEVNAWLEDISNSSKENMENIGACIRSRALKTSVDIKQIFLKPMDEAISEVKDLSYNSSAMKSLIDRLYVRIMDTDGLQQLNSEVKDLVVAVNGFSLRGTTVWLRIYQILAVLHGIVAFVSHIVVLRVLLQFNAFWTWWQDGFILGCTVCFGSAIFFIDYYSFLAMTGQLNRISSWMTRKATKIPQISDRRDVEAQTQRGDADARSCWRKVKDAFIAYHFWIFVVLFTTVFITLLLVPDVAPKEMCKDLQQTVVEFAHHS